MILIVPESNADVALGGVRRLAVRTLPFGLATLGGILERAGIPVRIINETIAPIDRQVLLEASQAEQGNPVFGISSLTLQAQRAKELLRLIRESVPGAKAIVGGIHATAMPEEFLEAGFDYAFGGEADSVITEIATGLSAGRDITHVPGLMWKDGNGVIHRNAPPPLCDLQSLPAFPYHLFGDDLTQYELGAVMSSRGCPYGCVFCSQRIISGRSYRTRPVGHILEEIHFLNEKHHIDHVVFYDDNFAVNRHHTQALCAGIVSRGLHRKVGFVCQMRGDAVTPELLQMLKEANFRVLSFGIETGSERIAGLIQKGETVECNSRAVRLAKDFGFRVMATFMIGFPTETASDLRQTLALARALPLDTVRINIAIPYPGTPLYERVRDSITVSPGWRNFNVVSPLVASPFSWEPLPYVPGGTTANELRFLMIWNNLAFWLRPKGLAAFFAKTGTTLTRVPKGWFLNPAILYALFRTGSTLMLNLVWCAMMAIKTCFRKGNRS